MDRPELDPSDEVLGPGNQQTGSERWKQEVGRDTQPADPRGIGGLPTPQSVAEAELPGHGLPPPEIPELRTDKGSPDDRRAREMAKEIREALESEDQE